MSVEMSAFRRMFLSRYSTVLKLSILAVLVLLLFDLAVNNGQKCSIIVTGIYFMMKDISNHTYNRDLAFLSSLDETDGSIYYLRNVTPRKELPPEAHNPKSVYWRFVNQISTRGLYEDPYPPGNEQSAIDALLDHLGSQEIVKLRSEDMTGTEFKFTATFRDGSKAIMKPMRHGRSKQVPINNFYYSEQERHHAEIAAFHLDRILGFRSVPPCIGRSLNITSDILKLADDQFIETVFQAPNGDWCFHGRCIYFCDIHHPFCGAPHMIEFSTCVMIPFEYWPSKPVMSPWRRSYASSVAATWQKRENNTYCQKIMTNDTTYKSGDRIFQLVDLYLFDFLMGNQDRHHYEVFRDFNHSFVTFDNGRGFGRDHIDEMWIIAPLFQCCKIRKSTYEKLVFFDTKRKLSTLMRHSLARDPLSANAPLLTERHLKSLDRRVKILLSLVEDCSKTQGGLEHLFSPIGEVTK